MPKDRVARARTLRMAMPPAERLLWSRLRAHRLAAMHARRQVPCGPFVADFLIRSSRLVIEVDGATHSTDAEVARDARRDRWFLENGYRVLRVTNDDIYHRIDGVLETILAHVEGRA